MKLRVGLLILALIVFTVCVIRADDKVAPKPIQITDEATRRAIQDSYNAVVSANKDLQIALLNAKVKYHVDETWRIDLTTLTFSPPPDPVEKPAKP